MIYDVLKRRYVYNQRSDWIRLFSVAFMIATMAIDVIVYNLYKLNDL